MSTTSKSARISVQTCAQQLGVHRNTVVREIEAGRLPAIRVGAGGLYKVLPEDLEAYIARNTVTAVTKESQCLEPTHN
jgi:excisionase family DNA binding protein